MTATDLWPDFKIELKPRTVRHVLEEAGAGLKEKTRGHVEFRVYPGPSTGGAFPFNYTCVLAVPRLGYEYQFLRVMSAPTGFPVNVVSDWKSHGEFQSEEALIAELATIFQSDRTKQIIQNLISMATD